MTSLFLLICCATVLLSIGVASVLIGSFLLGRPLSKGCGRSDCCQKKKSCPREKQNSQTDNYYDDSSSSNPT
ncbi:YSIRK-type signal peptide-containing protein [Chlamydia trachomatis]|nr:YSIRK-type signal peptide-containing protein [Chlamydia trachomatis]